MRLCVLDDTKYKFWVEYDAGMKNKLKWTYSPFFSTARILPPNTLYTLKIIVSGIKELAIIEYDNPGNK